MSGKITPVSRRRLQVGDHAPIFACPDSDGVRFEFKSHVLGKPVVMVFNGDTPLPQLAPMLRGIDDDTAQVLAFVPADVAATAAAKAGAGWSYRTMADDTGEITGGFASLSGVTAPAVYVLDPNQRIADIVPLDGSDGLVARINACIQAVRFDGAATCVQRVAPVLLVPNVLDAAECAWVIDLWRDGEKQEGTVGYGKSKGDKDLVNRDFKRRLDYVIKDGQLQETITNLTMTRLVPEIEKILHFRNWQLEAFRVGCYTAENAGFFNIHRDNLNTASKYRRFALTINLNTGEYEGGDLRFPEYGPEVYRPPLGGAILFSCSMLHEVVPVTKGARYTLLSFLVEPPAKGP